MAEMTDEQIEKKIKDIFMLLRNAIDVAREIDGPRQTFSLVIVYAVLKVSHQRGMKYLLKTGKDIITNTNLMDVIKEEDSTTYNYLIHVFNEVIEDKYLPDFYNIPSIASTEANYTITEKDTLNPIGAIMDCLSACVEQCIALKQPALGGIFTTLIGLISIQNIDAIRTLCESCTNIIQTRNLMDEIAKKNKDAFTMMQEWSKQMAKSVDMIVEEEEGEEEDEKI